MRLSIIVVSYNTAAMTVAALRSVVAETLLSDYELIVVDNASSDGSAEQIAAAGLPLRLIRLGDNVGFARANVVAAAGATGDVLLLLNPDTVVRANAIDRLVAFADANPGAGIWGGRTVFAGGRLNASCCWRRSGPWNALCRALGLTGLLPRSPIFNAEAYGGWQRDRVRAVDIVSGCFFLIRRSLWDRLGGFDPAFFMYGEEADLCARARKLGARPLFTPYAEIVHHGGASEPVRALKMQKLLAAKALLVRRHWHPATQPLGLALLALWPLSRALALRLADALRGRCEHDAASACWREIWRGRRNWLAAYGTAAEAAATIR